MLKGKTVVVGVCGGIAAYKVVEVVSKFKKLNADVHVVMTDSASKFVTPLTFQSISQNQVIIDMFSEPKSWEIQHISLATKADLFVIAPATANIIGKVANGIADDMLSTTIMATKAPVLFVPAMNTNMFENPIVQENITKLKKYGYKFMEPDIGNLACGTSGKGRMPEPCAIVDNALDMFIKSNDMKGINVLVTAGPTIEAIDPVRYISNHSSGKMGYAIAQAAAKRGANVKLVSGPVGISVPEDVEVSNVLCAVEMYNEVMECFKDYDVLIMVAAVADYRPEVISNQKIKKKDDQLNIKLTKNPDIAKELGKQKGNKILVGFCAETDDLINNANNKIKSKNLDIIIANDVTLEGAGFGVDTNIVKIIDKYGNVIELPKMSKSEVAAKIINEVLKFKREEK